MTEQYFTPEPSTASRRSEVELKLPDFRATLTVDRGVFSAAAVDPGTLALLRESPPPPVAGDILDLGCGYGAIACTLAHRSPSATVWAVDVNRRARELTAHNAERLGLRGVRTAAPDEVPPDLRFAGIWSNPPIRIGKPALQELLATWLSRLNPGAAAWLVVHRHLGSDSLAAWIASTGLAVARAASKSGYRVLRVEHP